MITVHKFCALLLQMIVNLFRKGSAANAIAGFKDANPPTLLGQRTGGRQSGDTGANDDRLLVH
jgi:hypothetical protein